MGKIIVIEGLDGSGKATQTKLLYEKLLAAGKQVRRLEFPDYENPSSALVKMYLSGDFGKDPADVNAYAASAFYAVDRVASFLQVWKKDYPADTVFLCDRYATSNIIYQMAKVPASERDAFIAWQQDFEYDKLGLPRPDAVIYLVLSCRESALYAAEKCSWQIINCCSDGDIKPIGQIAEEIENKLKGVL